MRDELNVVLADGSVTSLAELFHALPEDLRRPVEILGVLPLARRHGVEPTGETERYETVRADGTRRLLNVPRYAHTTAARTPDPADAAGTTAPVPGDHA